MNGDPNPNTPKTMQDTIPKNQPEDQTAYSGSPSQTCCVFLVFREHNRGGETLVETYNNREAAEQHVKHLDDTIDGWENMVGGWIEEEEIQTTFSPHNADPIHGEKDA